MTSAPVCSWIRLQCAGAWPTSSPAFVGPGRGLREGVDDDHIGPARSVNAQHQVAHVVLRAGGAGAQHEERHALKRCLLLRGIGRQALAKAVSAFRSDIGHSACLGAPAAPVQAPRDGHAHVEHHEALARAAGTVQHRQAAWAVRP